jgi:hypothetical protein
MADASEVRRAHAAAACASSRTNAKIQSPPMATGAAASSQWSWSPSGWNAGAACQNVSTHLIARSHAARAASRRELRFVVVESRSAKGTEKWPTTSRSPTSSQPPRSRLRYQPVSSGMSADQMIMN